MKSTLKNWRVAALVMALLCAIDMPAAAQAADWSIDEARFGLAGSIQSHSTFEAGLFPSVTLFFDPFDAVHAATWQDTFLRPRVHTGAIVSTSGDTSQFFAGVNWTVDLTDSFFLNAGFGGALHDGDLRDDGTDGPKLGCRVLFSEYAAAGFRFNEKLAIVATVDHASNANLCGNSNDGISHAGLSLAYRF